jgi:hypothetical protein
MQGCNPVSSTPTVSQTILINPSASRLENSPTQTRTRFPTRTKAPKISRTSTSMFSPTFTATQLPTVADEKIPQRVKDWAASAGMTPSEVVYIVNQIQSAARDYNPKLLIDFLLFPLHQEFRCPGDMIETPDEFVERFPELMDEKTRSGILNFMMEDLIINSYGVGLEFEIGDYTEVIWFSAYCNDTGCDNHHFVFITLLGIASTRSLGVPNTLPTRHTIRYDSSTARMRISPLLPMLLTMTKMNGKLQIKP